MDNAMGIDTPTDARPLPAQDNSPPAGADRVTAGLKMLATVAVYAAIVLLPFLGSSRTLTDHETTVARPAMDILRNGDWLVPQLLGRPWIHKPPLSIWLTAPLFAVFGGFSEFATRFHSALSAIALCVVVAALTRRYYGPRAGLLAGLVQATCVYVYMQGRLGEPDMAFTFLVASALAVLAWHWGEGSMKLPLASAALFHSLMGLAVLAKGPLAIVLVGLCVLGYSAVRRSAAPIKAVLVTPAVILSVVIGFGWYAAVAFHLGGNAIQQWDYSYVQRFFGRYHLKGAHNPLYYLYTIPWLVLPWSIVLFLGARRLIGEARSSTAYLPRFLWTWFLAGLVFLSAASFRHHHYCFLILPPLSVFCGRLLAEHMERGGRSVRKSYAVLFTLIPVVFLIISGVVMPRVDHRRPTVEFVRQAIPTIPPEDLLCVAGLAQSAVYPYIDRDFQYINDPQEIEPLLQTPPEKTVWVLTMRDYLELGALYGLRLDETAAEQPRAKHPPKRVLVVGRMVRSPNGMNGRGSGASDGKKMGDS